MNDDGRAALPRCAVVWLTTTAGTIALGAWLLPDLGDARRTLTGPGPAGLTFDQLLLWTFAAAVLVGVGWLWTVTTLATLEAALGRSTHPGTGRGINAGIRRLVLAACGVALAGGLSTPALATPGQLHQDRAGASTGSAVRGLPLPDRPSSGGTRDPVVVVRPGDTLWELAARQLPRTADAAAVAARCRLIHELNRDLIGDDPDLIHPAQRLRIPGS